MIPRMEQTNGVWRGRINLNAWNDFFGKNLIIELNIGGEIRRLITLKQYIKKFMSIFYIIKVNC